MVEFEDHAKISLVTNASQFNDLTEDLQKLVGKYDLNQQQLSNIFELSKNALENEVSSKTDLSQDRIGKIQHKLDMLLYGFDSIDAKERAILLLNDLLTDYLLSTEILAKIIKVREKELIAFRQNELIARSVELKICVNVIMLHFVIRT